MQRAMAGFVGSLALIMCLSAGGAAAQEDNAVPDALSATVDNPYFPLEPGTSRRYEVHSACRNMSPPFLMRLRGCP